MRGLASFFGAGLPGLATTLSIALLFGLSTPPLVIVLTWVLLVLVFYYTYAVLPRWVSPDGAGRRHVTTNPVIWFTLAGCAGMLAVFVIGYNTLGSARPDRETQKLALDLLIAGFGGGGLLLAVFAFVPRVAWDAEFIYHRTMRLRWIVVPWPDVVSVTTNFATGYHHIRTYDGVDVPFITMNKGAGALWREAKRWAVPLPPLFETAVRPADAADCAAFDAALAAMLERDPRFTLRRSADGATVSGPTAAHLTLLLRRLRETLGREIVAEPPALLRCATVRTSAAGKAVREIARGSGVGRAVVELVVLPSDPPMGNRAECDCVPADSPVSAIVLRAVEEVVMAGPPEGRPMLGVEARVIAVEWRPDAGEEVLALAAADALRAALADAQPVALEPWMRCYLEIPPDAVDATRDFWRAHKGEARVLPRDQDGDGRIASIEARAPLAELDRYGDELMRITQGCAQPLLYFDGFQPVRAA